MAQVEPGIWLSSRKSFDVGSDVVMHDAEEFSSDVGFQNAQRGPLALAT
jgi:hypothetical protein